MGMECAPEWQMFKVYDRKNANSKEMRIVVMLANRMGTNKWWVKLVLVRRKRYRKERYRHLCVEVKVLVLHCVA